MRSLTPPQLCAPSPTQQLSQARPCAAGGDRKDRGPALPLCHNSQPGEPSKKLWHITGRRDISGQGSNKPRLHLLFPCPTAPPKRCPAAITRWPGCLTHVAPHRKDLKTSLKHLCEHESSGHSILHPPLIPKARDSDSHSAVSPQDPVLSPVLSPSVPSAAALPQELQPAGQCSQPRASL